MKKINPSLHAKSFLWAAKSFKKINTSLMKKSLLFLIAMVFGFVSWGQTYLTESFEGTWSGTPAAPSGWTSVQNAAGTGTSGTDPIYWAKNTWSGSAWAPITTAGVPTTPAGAYDGSAVAWYNDYNARAPQRQQLSTGNTDLSTSTNPRVTFYLALSASSSLTLKLRGSNDGGSTWADIQTITKPGVAWTKVAVSIPGTYKVANARFGIEVTASWGSYDIFLDKFIIAETITADAAPISFNPTAITASSMTIGWTDNSTNETAFRVYRSTDNITFVKQGTDITSTTIAGLGTTYSQAQTGLIPGTMYYYKIAAVAEAESPYLTGSQATNPPGNIISAATGNWSATATWVGGVVPTSTDNVTIADGHTVVLDAAGTCNNLTVSGTTGILEMKGFTLTVNNNMSISEGATVRMNSTVSTAGNISISGNLTNNGTLDLYASSTNYAKITFTGTSDATFTLNTGSITDLDGSTASRGVNINKGTSSTTILDFVYTAGSLTVQGVSPIIGCFYITNGTLKISGTNTISFPVFSIASYTIPATGGFWLNNANFTVPNASLAGTGPLISGLFRLSAGTITAGNVNSCFLTPSNGSIVKIEGGTLNVTGRFGHSSNTYNYIQSGGTVKVGTMAGYTSSTYHLFDARGTSNFEMSGGTIEIQTLNVNVNGYEYGGPTATTNISGGTLQLGNANSGASALTFEILGNTPSIVLNNTSANHNITIRANTTVYGDLTLNGTGTFSQGFGFALTIKGNSVSNPGNISNNGTMTFNGSDGNILTFNSSFGNQTFINNGTITTSQLPQIVINNTYSGGTVTLPANMIIKPSNTYTGLTLTAGILTASNLTLGSGGSNGFKLAVGNGSFTNNPTYNLGTGTLSLIYNGTNAKTTGTELPSTIGGSLTINNAAGITLGNPTSVSSLTLTSGNLTTTSANLLTISGTTAGSISRTAGYINGPIARTLPLSLASGSTYLFPVGKGSYNPFELVNPTTNSGGTVVISSEVFDANCGGTSGTNMSTLNTNRYWSPSITSGASNFTSTFLKLTDASLGSANAIAGSATQGGSYDLIGGTAAVITSNTIQTTAPAITSLSNFYVMGLKSVPMAYTSSTVTQNTTIVPQGTNNVQVIGVQIVATGNASPISVTSFTLNANGTTNVADISNAKIYYTGTSSTFATTNQFGTVVASPTIENYDVTGTQSLAEGTNYFWLTYDIPSAATSGNVVDAECTSLTVASAQTPTVTAPAGTRSIVLGAVTTFPFTDDFETSNLNKWIVVNGAQTNKWYAGTATNNGGTNSAYISNNSGSTNAYSITNTSVVHFYRDITFPASGEYHLAFDWKGQGESSYDDLKVFLIDPATTPVAGIEVASGQIGVAYGLQGTWQSVDLTFAAGNLGTTKRLVFSWRNDVSGGTQPPAAIDNIVLKLAENMAYVSSTTTQAVTSTVNAGTTSQQVIGIQVVTTGSLNLINLTKLTINANGTTSVSDVSNAKIWYTGTSSTFSASGQFGSTITSTTTSNFDVSGTQTLAQGINYFWVTYDIASTAVNTNVIDGECAGVTVGGTDYVPTSTAPTGTRAIVNKTITSIAGVQASTALVLQGATNQPVLRLDYVVAGPSGGSLLLNSIAATYTGTIASDIAASGVKLYWTTNTTFATTNLLGTAQSLVAGVASFSTLNYNLPTGTSYVWVAFDIDAAAIVNNTVDAKIAVNGIDVAGTTYNGTDIDPAGTRTIKAALSGTYTVGVGGNYTSFTKVDGLFNDINSLGLSGNVTINVISDITDETGAIALNQWTETGAGNYTLTIQPDGTTERLISSTAAAHLFTINGADRVTFDGRYSGNGKYLRIRNTNTGYTTFRFTTSAQNNAIKYCFVEGANSSTTSGVFEFTAIGNNNSNLIDNCVVRDRSDVSGRPANSFYFAGKANASTNTISNSEIFNFTTYGVNLAGATSSTISGNLFYMTSASSVATIAGIYIGDAPSTSIIGNKIYDLNGSSSAAVKGIYYLGASSVSMNADIINNAIYLSPTTTGNIDGIDYFGYSANSCNIYFNSISIGGTHTSGTNATYAFRKRDVATTMNIKNNIFVNARSNSGATAKHYSIAFTTTTATSLSIDYNDYFTSGTGGVLGIYTTTDKTTIADWKTATIQDAASKSLNPNFASATDLSLVVSNNLGTPISGITTDFAGTTRDLSNPDMGAYESSVANAVAFNGATNAWEVATNWTPNAVPNFATNVTIPANLLAVVNSNNYECNNLTIAPKGELTINAAKDLLVNGALTLQSDATGTASLVELGTLVANSNIVQRYIPNDNSWHFLSSPVASQPIIGQFAPSSCNIDFDFYKWDETVDMNSGFPWVNLRQDATTYNSGFETHFAVGKGYLVAYSPSYTGSATHNFTGNLNSGDKSIAVSITGNTYNLIGNPYVSAIDWDASAYTNRDSYLANTNPTIWIWNGTLGNYGSYTNGIGGTLNATNIIAPHQGFFVNSLASGSFTIPNSARVHPGSQNFLKSTPADLIRLKVSSTINTYSDEIIVNFNSNATANEGVAKWFSLLAEAPSLYTVKNAKNLSINTLTAITNNLEVPVSFNAGINGNYTLKASELSSFTSHPYIYLKDLKTNTLQDLNQNAVYAFTGLTTDNPNRFQLVFAFSPLGIGNQHINAASIYAYDNTIYINSMENIQQITVYNTLGQLVKTIAPAGMQTSFSLNGMPVAYYIVRVITDKNVYSEKVLVK